MQVQQSLGISECGCSRVQVQQSAGAAECRCSTVQMNRMQGSRVCVLGNFYEKGRETEPTGNVST